MPKAKYEFQKLVVEYSQAFKTKSLKIWKTSNFSIKIVTIIVYITVFFFDFLFIPLRYGMAQFHISLDPIFC